MVYLFLGDGFEETEAIGTVDLLRRAGISVTTVGVTDKTVKGSHGIHVLADCVAADFKSVPDDLEMVVLPGGLGGVDQLSKSEKVDAFLFAAKAKNAYLAAICAAPTLLAKRGLLKGLNATCYPGMEGMLTGAIPHDDCGALRDGNVITGRSAGTVYDFALELIRALRGDAKAAEVAEAIKRI